MYFEIRQDKDGYRARFFRNGRLIWWTEGYENRADAERAVTIMRTYAATAPLR